MVSADGTAPALQGHGYNLSGGFHKWGYPIYIHLWMVYKGKCYGNSPSLSSVNQLSMGHFQ